MRPCHKYVKIESEYVFRALESHLQEEWSEGRLAWRTRRLPAKTCIEKLFNVLLWLAFSMQYLGAWRYLRAVQAYSNTLIWKREPLCEITHLIGGDCATLLKYKLRPSWPDSKLSQNVWETSWNAHPMQQPHPHLRYNDLRVLFAYDYKEMVVRMKPLKGELLRAVMHPRNLNRLKGLGLVN